MNTHCSGSAWKTNLRKALIMLPMACTFGAIFSFPSLVAQAGEEMGKTEYQEDFETENRVTFWTGTGEYKVNYAGLSSERSHSGKKSFKLDITLIKDGNYNYWSGPILDIPAIPGTRLTGFVYLEQAPPNVSVSLGTSFLLPALRETTGGSGRGSCVAIGSLNRHDEMGTWHRQTSDILIGAEGTSRKILGEVTPALHLEKWYIGISCREAVDARLVIYIDDISIEGGPVPENWQAEQDRLLKTWAKNHNKAAIARNGPFREITKRINEEAKTIAREISESSLREEKADGVWQRHASGMLDEARKITEELVERTRPDFPVPEKDKLLEIHLHDLRNQWLHPARWALDNAHKVWLRTEPYLLTVSNDPITNYRVLPTSRILTGKIDSEIDLFACPGEYTPASFVLVPSNSTTATFKIGDLTSGENTIAAANLDLKSVKVWYQAGISFSELDKKLLTPELLLNDDALVQVDYEAQANNVRDIDHPRDAAALLPVPIPAETAKQFWLTVHVPESALPGTYHGSILIELEGVAKHRLPVRLEVLPFKLKESSLHFGLYYRGVLSATRQPEFVTSELKTEHQLETEFRNMKEHGILYPDVYQRVYLQPDGTLDTEELARYLDIRDRTGLPRDKLFYDGNGIDVPATEDDVTMELDFFRKMFEWARNRGYEEVYFFGSDEAQGEQLVLQRGAWAAIRNLGARIAVACDTGFFALVGDLLDLPIMNGMSPEELPKVHALGHKMFNYSLPQGGLEQPYTYRYFFGHWLLQSGMDGSQTYAYQHGFGPGGSMGRPWDDFDNAIYRPHIFAYPTVDGVVDTLQWEGVREAVDDTRYVATLRAAIDETQRSGNKLGEEAERWLEQVDITGDLHAIRRAIADRIIELKAAK